MSTADEPREAIVMLDSDEWSDLQAKCRAAMRAKMKWFRPSLQAYVDEEQVEAERRWPAISSTTFHKQS
jgi:hypothetical protein